MKIGAQLYTLRDHTKTPEEFERSLDRVAALGFEGVQLSAVDCLEQFSGSKVRALLDSRNLKCVATHRSWNALVQSTQQEIDLHLEWACDYIAVAVPPPGVHERALEGYREWLDQLKSLSETFRLSGIDLGYHNHALEFEKFENGVRPYDLLMAAEWLPLELDTCWVHAAGMSVVPLIEKLNGRLRVVHLKDRVVYGWEVVDGVVGEGNLDWEAILSSFKRAGTDWLLIEQDTCKRNPFDCLQSSLEYVRRLLKTDF